MRKILTLLLLVIFFGGCATQQSAKGSHACGSKQQKKAKYNSMKQGRSPGGGMLN